MSGILCCVYLGLGIVSLIRPEAKGQYLLGALNFVTAAFWGFSWFYGK